MSKRLGDFGEAAAAEFLESKGYKVIDKNIRNIAGEVDIIAVKGDTLFLVEVKTRQDTKFGYPEEYVTNRKLERIKNAGVLHKQQQGDMLPDKIRI